MGTPRLGQNSAQMSDLPNTWFSGAPSSELQVNWIYSTNHVGTQRLALYDIGAGWLSAPVQGVHFWNEVVDLEGPLTLVTPVWQSHIIRPTWNWSNTRIHASDNIGVISSSFLSRAFEQILLGPHKGAWIEGEGIPIQPQPRLAEQVLPEALEHLPKPPDPHRPHLHAALHTLPSWPSALAAWEPLSAVVKKALRSITTLRLVRPHTYISNINASKVSGAT